MRCSQKHPTPLHYIFHFEESRGDIRLRSAAAVTREAAADDVPHVRDARVCLRPSNQLF